MRNEIPELQQLPDYWLIKQLFLCILQTFPFFPAFKSDPALSYPLASPYFSLSLSLFQLTVKRLVICNGNDTP